MSSASQKVFIEQLLCVRNYVGVEELPSSINKSPPTLIRFIGVPTYRKWALCVEREQIAEQGQKGAGRWVVLKTG